MGHDDQESVRAVGFSKGEDEECMRCVEFAAAG